MLQEKNSKAVKSRFASPARAVKVCIGVIAWSEPAIALWFCGHFSFARENRGAMEKRLKKNLSTCEAGGKSRKRPTSVVGKKPYGKCQLNDKACSDPARSNQAVCPRFILEKLVVHSFHDVSLGRGRRRNFSPAAPDLARGQQHPDRVADAPVVCDLS